MQIEYRLTVCPELCAGVFQRNFSQDASNNAGGSNSAQLETTADGEAGGGENGFYVVHSTPCSDRLVGCVIATKTHSPVVNDASMEIPELDEYHRVVAPQTDDRGHRDDGNTIAVHIVVVDPELQGQSLGTLMLKDYIQRMTTLHVGKSIAIIVHDRLVPFYEKLGFEKQGPSACTFSGGGWIDMVRPVSETDEEEED